MPIRRLLNIRQSSFEGNKMKRVFYCFLLAGLLFATQAASAQLSLGFVGVFNLPNLTIDADGFGSTKGSTGFGGGIVAQYKLSENVSVAIQPTYLSNKGADLGGLGIDFDELLDELVDLDFSADIKISTIEIPILIKYYFSDYSARPYLVAGPSIGFISTAELNAQISGTIPAFGIEPATDLELAESLDLKDELSSVDISFLLGLGVDVPMGSSRYFMDVKYGFGLSNLIADGDGSMKSKGLRISAGARFPFGSSNQGLLTRTESVCP